MNAANRLFLTFVLLSTTAIAQPTLSNATFDSFDSFSRFEEVVKHVESSIAVELAGKERWEELIEKYPSSIEKGYRLSELKASASDFGLRAFVLTLDSEPRLDMAMIFQMGLRSVTVIPVPIRQDQAFAPLRHR